MTHRFGGARERSMRRLRRMLGNLFKAPTTQQTLFPAGHFYSPIVDVDELRARQALVWPSRPSVLGIDFNDAHHERVLREYFPAFYSEFAYPKKPDGDALTFYLDNDQFRLMLVRGTETAYPTQVEGETDPRKIVDKLGIPVEFMFP